MANATHSFRVLFSNSSWNVVGQGSGLFVALAAIPILLKNLGQDQFGIFSICLALIGYSGVLDLGIGRAITARIAIYSAERNEFQATATTTAALYLLSAIGLLVAILIGINATRAATFITGSSNHLYNEAVKSIYILAITSPIVLLSSGLRGILEGLQDFKAVAKITIPSGIMMFAAPAAISFVTPRGGLLHINIVGSSRCYFNCIICQLQAPDELSSTRDILDQKRRDLLRLGSWITISNIVSPIMNNLDRIFISAYISPAATTLHVTSYELATKSLLPAGSIANAAFPAFATSNTTLSKHSQRRYFWQAMAITSAASFLPGVLIYSFAGNILSIWISPEFASGVSTEILQVFAIGIVINGSAFIPFAYVQGIGRADIAAKFHLVELILFIPALLTALDVFGVKGAALVWVGRVLLDAILLFTYAVRKLE